MRCLPFTATTCLLTLLLVSHFPCFPAFQTSSSPSEKVQFLPSVVSRVSLPSSHSSLFPFPFCPSRCPYRPLQDHTVYTTEDHFIYVMFSTNATSSLPLLPLRFLAFFHFSDLVHDFLQAGKILSRIPKSLQWQRS